MEWEALRPGVAFESRIYNLADGPLDRKRQDEPRQLARRSAGTLHTNYTTELTDNMTHFSAPYTACHSAPNFYACSYPACFRETAGLVARKTETRLDATAASSHDHIGELIPRSVSVPRYKVHAAHLPQPRPRPSDDLRTSQCHHLESQGRPRSVKTTSSRFLKVSLFNTQRDSTICATVHGLTRKNISTPQRASRHVFASWCT